MIELKMDGVCERCVFRELTLIAWSGTVRCKHDEVCRFIHDPHGEEKYQEERQRARAEAMRNVIQQERK